MSMAQFSVKPENARTAADAESQLIRELDGIENEICSVRNQLGFQVAAKANIRNRLGSAANRVSGHRSSMSSMHSALQNVVNAYNRTENTITGNTNVEAAKIQNLSGSEYENSSYTDGSIKRLEDYFTGILEMPDFKEYHDYIFKRIESIKEFIGKVYHCDFSALGFLLSAPELLQGDIAAFNTFVSNIKDKVIDKTGIKAEAKVRGALYENKISCPNGSAGVSALVYDAYASAEAGLMSKDENGNLMINPHIDTKVGASFTALEAAGAYAVGDEWMGADVNGNVTVGKVSGQAELTAGLRDKDGSFNPHAKLDASAEAILIDAKAQAGATVLGTRAEVEGSVNVGIGAHANMEIGDGKISCDIGASLGIGASISFTIDYSGTVDAVKRATKGMAESILKKVKWW